jgi:hypothetical protein
MTTHRTPSRFALSIPVALSLGLVACVASPAGDDGSEVRQAESLPLDTVGVGSNDPAPPVETPTTLTFYESIGLGGLSYTVSLTPSTNGFEATRQVTSGDLAAHGLAGKVSSVQIVCGSRPSQVSLFDVDWSEFSVGTMLSCAAHASSHVDLTTVGYNDRISAAALVAHARSVDGKVHYTPFSILLAGAWSQGLGGLPSGASASGGGEIWLETFQTVRIHQALTLDSLYCTKRDATFDLRVRMSTVDEQPVFDATVMSVWVAYGLGDAWGCHDGMVSKLQSGAESAAAQLAAGLPKLFELVGTQNGAPLPSPTHYFAPNADTRNFDGYMPL